MNQATLYPAVEATWPPTRCFRAGPWTIRDGAGGGKRASAATAEAPVTEADIATLEAEMAALDQPSLVMIRAGEEALDQMLEVAGYAIVDPVVLYAAPVARLAEPPPHLAAFPHWPRLAAADEIWAEGGIGAARLAVMDRAAGPKTAILARADDTPAGAAFVAIHGQTAMIHAVEVAPALRRKGAARHMMQAAACWAEAEGATTLALAVTTRNAAARALYASLGMAVVGQYHYRMKPASEGSE